MTRIGFRNRSAPDCFLNKHFTTKYFTYRQIFAMLLPLILDQFFISIISLSLYLGGFAVFRGVGINGVWICMGLEWFVRSTIFGLRFRSGRWLKQNLYIFAE
ncbi:MAG: hypothetical protein MR943_00245 [Lachnobacterium sp.]|nr:hypothetical protein [Lachnobacterium sp.]